MRKMNQHRKKISSTFYAFVVLMVVCLIGHSSMAQQPQNSQQSKLANRIDPRLLKTTQTPSNNVRGRLGSTITKASAPSGSVYTFTGKGSWSDPLNWENKLVPPARLKPGDQVIINGTGSCVLNNAKPILLVSGSSLEIKEGKELCISIGNNFLLQGNLINNGRIKVLSGTLTTGFAPENISTTRGLIKTTAMSRVVERKNSSKEMKRE